MSRPAPEVSGEQGRVQHRRIQKATLPPLGLCIMTSARMGIPAGPGDFESPRGSPSDSVILSDHKHVLGTSEVQGRR